MILGGEEPLKETRTLENTWIGEKNPPPNRFGVDREPPLPPLTPPPKGGFFLKEREPF